jgi:gentisate 1,2-dioxygenase
VVPSEAMVWQWDDVAEAMSMSTDVLPKTYDGRRVAILYDPATGRLNGTTNALFAAFGQKEPNAEDHQHRHSSCSINYYLAGSGNSIVDDQFMEWKAGDLQFAAPAWSAHRHASGPNGLRGLTVQDHPFMIGMDALIWQERVDGPVLRLGGDVGAETNLVKAMAAAE